MKDVTKTDRVKEVLSNNILTLIVLDVVAGLHGLSRVSPHHVVIHQRRCSEQTEATGAAQHATYHMLCRLLQPMAHSVFKLLEPHRGTCRGKKKQYCKSVGFSASVVDFRADRMTGQLFSYFIFLCQPDPVG